MINQQEFLSSLEQVIGDELSRVESDADATINRMVNQYGFDVVRAAVAESVRDDIQREVEAVYRKYGLEITKVEIVLPHEKAVIQHG